MKLWHLRLAFYGYFAFEYGQTDLLSSPPIVWTILRSVKTTPKISFASSAVDSCLRPAPLASPLLRVLASDCGRELFDVGRGAHDFENMHSAWRSKM